MLIVFEIPGELPTQGTTVERLCNYAEPYEGTHSLLFICFSALEKLFSTNGGSHVMADILQRPVMSFVLQWNDLESLQVIFGYHLGHYNLELY